MMKVMTKIYSIPQMEVHPITPLLMLCASGATDRVSSNVNLKGGNNSGDATEAF